MCLVIVIWLGVVHTITITTTIILNGSMTDLDGVTFTAGVAVGGITDFIAVITVTQTWFITDRYSVKFRLMMRLSSPPLMAQTGAVRKSGGSFHRLLAGFSFYTHS